MPCYFTGLFFYRYGNSKPIKWTERPVFLEIGGAADKNDSSSKEESSFTFNKTNKQYNSFLRARVVLKGWVALNFFS